MLTHECKGNASYKHLSIKQENIDLYYKNKSRIFATVPEYFEKRKKQYLKECVDYAKSIVLTEKGNSINNESFSDDYILFVDGSNYQDYPYPYSNVFNKEQFEHWKKNHKKKFKDFDDFMKYVKSNL